MAHPAHKIAGPMLRGLDMKTGAKTPIATPDQVVHALSYPQALVPDVVTREWANEARRKNGLKGTSETAGEKFRTEQELRKKPKRIKLPVRTSYLQRLARRITRLFRK